jgi:hypothetical protein
VTGQSVTGQSVTGQSVTGFDCAGLLEQLPVVSASRAGEAG